MFETVRRDQQAGFFQGSRGKMSHNREDRDDGGLSAALSRAQPSIIGNDL